LNKNDAKIDCDANEFWHFRRLHVKCSGRITRSVRTWELQSEMMTAGEAFLSIDVGAGGFFIYNNHTCYYGVGASLEGANSHALIWKAILHAKGLGCRYMELGEQVFTGDKKLMGISKFKAGFGGSCQMRMDLRKKE
jgi:lipid II:glycine glycyltransferase (peptidoglycan interpeptide bridge formation enzyme)